MLVLVHEQEKNQTPSLNLLQVMVSHRERYHTCNSQSSFFILKTAFCRARRMRKMKTIERGVLVWRSQKVWQRQLKNFSYIRLVLIVRLRGLRNGTVRFVLHISAKMMIHRTYTYVKGDDCQQEGDDCLK